MVTKYSSSGDTDCGPNATLVSASRVLTNGANKLDSYLSWRKQRGGRYPYSTFLPKASDPCEGMSVHWDINSTYWKVAVAVRAKGWVALGLSQMGGMKGSDIVYFTVHNTSRLYDSYVTDYYGPPELDTRQDWILVGSSVGADGYLIFEAERLLDTHDAQDWPIYNDTSDFMAKHNIIGAWGDTRSISYHGDNWVTAVVQLSPSMNDAMNRTDNATNTDDGQQMALFHRDMESRSDGNVVLAVQDAFLIPQKETSSHEDCYTTSKLVKIGFPKTLSSTEGLYIVGIEFILPENSRNYVDRIYIFGHPNMHSWFLSSCDDHSIGTSFIWTRGHDFISFPSDLGFHIGKDGSNALSLHIHFNNPNLTAHVSGSGVGARMYYTNKKDTQTVSTILLGDPMVGLIGKPLGSGWTEHSFTCPSSCSDYLLLTAPNNGQVTVFQENFYMHGTGKRIVNQVLRNQTVVHEASVDYWDFSISGFKQVQQDPFIIKRGDVFRTICYYEDGDMTTTFGLGFQNEVCMAMLIYYPAQESVFRNICEPNNLLVSVCSEDYNQVTLQGEEDIGRVFGQDRWIYAPTMNPNILSPTSAPSIANGSKAVWGQIIKGFFILALLALAFFNFVIWAMRKAKRRWEAKQLQLEMDTDLELL